MTAFGILSDGIPERTLGEYRDRCTILSWLLTGGGVSKNVNCNVGFWFNCLSKPGCIYRFEGANGGKCIQHLEVTKANHIEIFRSKPLRVVGVN